MSDIPKLTNNKLGQRCANAAAAPISNVCLMVLLNTSCALVLFALTWLNPFAPGPSPSVAPLLSYWMCAAGLLGLCVRYGGRQAILQFVA